MLYALEPSRVMTPPVRERTRDHFLTLELYVVQSGPKHMFFKLAFYAVCIFLISTSSFSWLFGLLIDALLNSEFTQRPLIG